MTAGAAGSTAANATHGSREVHTVSLIEKRPFHILSVEGRPKVGKTHLAASAPGPIGIQSLDFGTEGIIEKFDRTEFKVREYDLAYDFTIKSRGDSAEAQSNSIRRDYWAPFEKDAHELFASCRTVVWDTATEVWEMLRLAHFGKLEQNPQLQYGPINAEYKALIRLANTHRTNLILIHHQTKKYNNVDGKSVETNEWKRQGNNKVEALVHSYVTMEYIDPVKNHKGEITKPGFFQTEINRARWCPENIGTVLEAPDWDVLMSFIHPQVEDWNA
jgi:hypothetical protein